MYPDERAKMLELIRENGVVRDYEVTTRNWEGSPMFVSVTSSFRKDREGNILGVEGVIRDITPRKRAEEEHALLVRAIEQVGEAILITDAKWQYPVCQPGIRTPHRIFQG